VEPSAPTRIPLAVASAVIGDLATIPAGTFGIAMLPAGAAQSTRASLARTRLTTHRTMPAAVLRTAMTVANASGAAAASATATVVGLGRSGVAVAGGAGAPRKSLGGGLRLFTPATAAAAGVAGAPVVAFVPPPLYTLEELSEMTRSGGAATSAGAATATSAAAAGDAVPASRLRFVSLSPSAARARTPAALFAEAEGRGVGLRGVGGVGLGGGGGGGAVVPQRHASSLSPRRFSSHRPTSTRALETGAAATLLPVA